MSRRITATISDEQYASFTELARDHGLSPNKYISNLITESLLENDRLSGLQKPECMPDENVNLGRRNYTLSGSYVSVLKRKAKAAGLTETAYLRLLIRSRDFKRIEYSVEDLNEYISQSQRLINSVTSFVALIESSGKGIVFEPDVKHMLIMLEEIKALCRTQVQQALQNRRAVYRKMIKKVEDELREQ